MRGSSRKTSETGNGEYLAYLAGKSPVRLWVAANVKAELKEIATCYMEEVSSDSI